MDKKSENIIIDDAESLKLIQDTIIQNSENYQKLGMSQLQGSDKITLKEEAERLRKDGRKSKGTICQCCGQKVQLYKRKLTAEMCVCLIYMLKFFRHQEEAELYQYYTMNDYFFEIIGNDQLKHILANFTKLRYWDLIAPMPTRPDKIVYKKGHYTLTENGLKFAQQEIGVPRYAFVYNDQVDAHSTEFVTITDILSEQNIDYEQLVSV